MAIKVLPVEVASDSVRLARLEREAKRLTQQREGRRRKRGRRGVPVLSIVGYTNAGKSTLLRALTQSDVHIEDKMFATLDPVSRRLRFPREREVIITDTVTMIGRLGCIRHFLQIPLFSF